MAELLFVVVLCVAFAVPWSVGFVFIVKDTVRRVRELRGIRSDAYLTDPRCDRRFFFSHAPVRSFSSLQGHKKRRCRSMALLLSP